MKNIFKKFTIAAVALASAATYTGCQSDLLDTAPTYMYSSSNVWQSPILARSAVKGVYNALYARFTQNYSGSSLGIPMDCWSSVMDIDRNWRGGLFICTGSCTPSDGNVANHFKLFYTIVYRANDAINHLGDVPDMTDEEKSRLISECKFLRAWGYFYLNLYWRGVPLYLETVAPEEATLPRSTEAEVWEQVIKDLTDVINDQNIPDKYNKGNANYGNATRGAALAYRGQVYQHMGDNAKALADFEAVERCGFSLYSPSNGAPGNRDFFDLLRPANEQCDEMIFSIQCVETSNMGNPRGINYGNRVTGGSAWNNYLPNPAYVEMFECADGSKFDWEKYCPGWHQMEPEARKVFFLRDGLASGDYGVWGTTATTSYDHKYYENMEASGADMSKYIDNGNEARIKKAYDDRDPRLKMAIITPYSEYDGNEDGVGNHTWVLRWPYILDAGAPYDIRTDTNAYYYYLWRKYVTENDECTTRWVYPMDIILCRYAEILLRRAECLNELGRTNEAIDLVNMVRKRAGHVLLNDPAYPATAVQGLDDMRERIRTEYYVELGGEDSMFANELRWGTWQDRKFRDHSSGKTDAAMNTNGLMQMWGTVTYYNVSVGDKMNVWPIPAKEREMNPSLTQNPGWND